MEGKNPVGSQQPAGDEMGSCGSAGIFREVCPVCQKLPQTPSALVKSKVGVKFRSPGRREILKFG